MHNPFQDQHLKKSVINVHLSIRNRFVRIFQKTIPMKIEYLHMGQRHIPVHIKNLKTTAYRVWQEVQNTKYI